MDHDGSDRHDVGDFSRGAMGFSNDGTTFATTAPTMAASSETAGAAATAEPSLQPADVFQLPDRTSTIFNVTDDGDAIDDGAVAIPTATSTSTTDGGEAFTIAGILDIEDDTHVSTASRGRNSRGRSKNGARRHESTPGELEHQPGSQARDPGHHNARTRGHSRSRRAVSYPTLDDSFGAATRRGTHTTAASEASPKNPPSSSSSPKPASSHGHGRSSRASSFSAPGARALFNVNDANDATRAVKFSTPASPTPTSDSDSKHPQDQFQFQFHDLPPMDVFLPPDQNLPDSLSVNKEEIIVLPADAFGSKVASIVASGSKQGSFQAPGHAMSPGAVALTQLATARGLLDVLRGELIGYGPRASSVHAMLVKSVQAEEAARNQILQILSTEIAWALKAPLDRAASTLKHTQEDVLQLCHAGKARQQGAMRLMESTKSRVATQKSAVMQDLHGRWVMFTKKITPWVQAVLDSIVPGQFSPLSLNARALRDVLPMLNAADSAETSTLIHGIKDMFVHVVSAANDAGVFRNEGPSAAALAGQANAINRTLANLRGLLDAAQASAKAAKHKEDAAATAVDAADVLNRAQAYNELVQAQQQSAAATERLGALQAQAAQMTIHENELRRLARARQVEPVVDAILKTRPFVEALYAHTTRVWTWFEAVDEQLVAQTLACEHAKNATDAKHQQAARVVRAQQAEAISKAVKSIWGSRVEPGVTAWLSERVVGQRLALQEMDAAASVALAAMNTEAPSVAAAFERTYQRLHAMWTQYVTASLRVVHAGLFTLQRTLIAEAEAVFAVDAAASMFRVQ